MDKFSNKTVLVTGATGLIGSHIVYRLMEMDSVSVIVLGRNIKKLQECFSKYLNNKNFKCMAQDIADPLNLCSDSIDYIFHAAGPMEGKIIKNQPVDVISPNLKGTINCLEYLLKQEKEKSIKGRLVLFSSVTVYGNITNNDITVSEKDTNVTESLNSVSAPYSQSKRMSEVIVQAYRKQFNSNVVIARFSTVYGNTFFKPDTAFFEFIKKATTNENIILNSSGSPKRDNIYIDDAINGVLLVATNGIDGEAYNISSNGNLDNFAAVDEIAEMISDIANRIYGRPQSSKMKVIYKSGDSGERKGGIKLNNSKLKSLGWEEKVSIKNGIEKCIKEIMNTK